MGHDHHLQRTKSTQECGKPRGGSALKVSKCSIDAAQFKAMMVDFMVKEMPSQSTSRSFHPRIMPRIRTQRAGLEKADLLPSTANIQDMLQTLHMSRQKMSLPSGLVFTSFWNLIIFRTVHLLRSVDAIFIHSFIWQIFILQTIWTEPWKFIDSSSLTLVLK